MAATWDSTAGTMAVYVNGQMAGSNSAPPRIAAFSTANFAVGADLANSQPARGTFDELRIGTRARSAAEILADYRQMLAFTGLGLSATNLPLTVGEHRRLTATAMRTFGGTVEVTDQVVWTSSNPAVATVDAGGRVAVVGGGSATITAVLGGFSATASVAATDLQRPIATLFPTDDVTIPGGSDYTFLVEYHDNSAVEAGRFNNENVRVVGDNGFARFADFAGVTPPGSGTERIAMYRIPAPGGAWDERDAGRYRIELVDRQIRDSSGNWAVAADLGSFAVHIGAPPRVQAVQVNDGSAQRSVVRQVTVVFDAPVSFVGAPSQAFRLSGPNGVVPVTVDLSDSTPGQTVARLNFELLPNGRYTLTVLGTMMADFFGRALDGNGDGTAGDNHNYGDPQNFYCLFGDANGDLVVNGADLSVFRSMFGATTTDRTFDVNGDGVINAADLNVFRANFGSAL